MGEHVRCPGGSPRRISRPRTWKRDEPVLKGLIATCPSRSSIRLPSYSCQAPCAPVADILALAEWPAEQLRLVVERWQPDVDVSAYGDLSAREPANAPGLRSAKRRG